MNKTAVVVLNYMNYRETMNCTTELIREDYISVLISKYKKYRGDKRKDHTAARGVPIILPEDKLKDVDAVVTPVTFFIEIERCLNKRNIYFC